MTVINIKYENKTVYSAMLKQYAKLYLIEAIDWFDTQSGAKKPVDNH